MKHIKNILFIFLKRNSLSRKNGGPAFRYFRHFVNGNAAIGASLNTSPRRTNFSGFTASHLITACLLLFLVQPAFAQNKKENSDRISIAKKAKYSLKDNLEHFNFKAKKAAIYDVIVLNPIANIISRPVKNKTLNEAEELNFSLNTKYWKPGTYRIFIQIDGVTVQQRKLMIKRKFKR